MNVQSTTRQQRTTTADCRGFSMVEVMIAMGITVVVMSIVFGFFVNTSKSYKSEQAGVDMQQAARVAVDELGRMLQQAGYGIDRPDAYNVGEWQKAIAYAGPHSVAFNADVDPAIGPIDASQTLTFPTGETYVGEGRTNVTVGAETYVYSIDANGDNNITLVDRNAAQSGSFNPAAGTDNPLDFALFQRVSGYNGTAYATTVAPIIPYLFTNAVESIKYADGTVPEPLFTYVLTEDLNGNGILDTGECVNDALGSCTRSPVNYLWGDTDFDGALSGAERTALLAMPVGSTKWSKNKLQSSGTFHSVTISTAIDPTDEYSYVVDVADASKLVPGAVMKLGTGINAEYIVVERVFTDRTPNQVILSANPDKFHSVGATMAIVEDSLLRAIRGVQINFTSISPRKDNNSSHAPAGQIGRTTSHGMDYRTLTLQRTVELVNMETVALRATTGPGAAPPPPELACPLTITPTCGGGTVSKLGGHVAGTVPLSFAVIDNDSNPVNGVEVEFSRTGSAGGSFSSDSVDTDEYGHANVNFTPTGGGLGSDTVTATVDCKGTDYTANVEIEIHNVELAVAHDCMSTITDRTTTPGTTFGARVVNADGGISGASVDLRLRIDEEFVSPADDYTNLTSNLYVGGSLVGTTDSSGKSPIYTATADSNGELTGAMDLAVDTSDGGTRVDIVATTSTTECSVYGGVTNETISFYKLTMGSTKPSSGCLAGAPCTIESGNNVPEVDAVLSIAGQVIPSAAVDFVKSDTHAVSPPAASVLKPGSTIVTNSSGVATLAVETDGSETITTDTPLYTDIDAVSTGESSYCSSGTIVPANAAVGFRFNGPVPLPYGGDLEMSQDWMTIGGKNNDEVCMHAFNPAEMGGCSYDITGIAVTLYEANGIDLDVSNEVDEIEGGTIEGSPTCAKGDKLFKNDCNGKKGLQAGEEWTFIDEGKNCHIPNELDHAADLLRVQEGQDLERAGERSSSGRHTHLGSRRNLRRGARRIQNVPALGALIELAGGAQPPASPICCSMRSSSAWAGA